MLPIIGVISFAATIIFAILIKKSKGKKEDNKSFKIGLVISAIVFIVCLINTPDKKDNKDKSNKPTSKTEEKSTEKETKESIASKETEAPFSNKQDTLDKIGIKIFGDDYKNAKMNWDYTTIKYKEDGSIDEENSTIDYLAVDVKLSDNLTENMTIKGFLMKVSDYLKTTIDVNYNRVFIGAKAEFKDQYGNLKEQYAVKIILNKEEVNKINFENFDYKNLPDIAESFDVHNGIKYNLD
ncbi:hypothetical protein [Miniphocaeibacter massiliensis]|uniref:hypothetical protein n=1 Tax=Miniphocaeibacter massiliensis TaxID=2041841 RepID=UPI000C1C2D1F|nr:hypothetical protein [Miniphocaeibacter massiliensis]